MAAADVTFWAFVWYLMNNPNKTHLSRQDVHEMAEMFAAENSDELSATDPGGTYTDIEWPGTITAVGNSSTDRSGNVSWDLVDSTSQVTLDQANFPEKHKGS